MAVTAQSFLLRYPEFRQAPESLIDAVLNEARTNINDAVWGGGRDPALSLTDQAVGLHAAAALFDSPYSRHMARTDEGDAAEKNRSDANPYRIRLERMKFVVSSGYRVL